MSLPGLLRLDPARLAPTGPDAEGPDAAGPDAEGPDAEGHYGIVDNHESAMQPPPSAAARSEAGPTRYADLPPDLQEEVQKRVLNFVDMYNASPDPDRFRVCVPHPVDIQKDQWLLSADALSLCEVNKENERWCKHLVAATIETERQYWAGLATPVNFDNVVTAIRKRHGYQVDVQAGVVRSLYSGKDLKRPNAIEVLIGARWWYPKYANPNRRAFASKEHLRTAVEIVAAAQLFVDAEDEWLAKSEQGRYQESFDFETVHSAESTPWDHRVDGEWPQRFLRPSVVYLARAMRLRYQAENPVPNAAGNHLPMDSANRPPSWWREKAMLIIDYYGPPDVWNVANLTDFRATFSDNLVNDATSLAQEHLLRLPGMYNTNVKVCPQWPVGLYDVSQGRQFDDMFSGNLLFDCYIGDWDMRNARTLTRMFFATRFNGPVEGWQMPALHSTFGMFAHNTEFNFPIDGWAPHMAVDRSVSFLADHMFQKARAFDQPIPAFMDRILDRNKGVKVSTERMFEGARTFLSRLRVWKKRYHYLGPNTQYVRWYNGDFMPGPNRIHGRQVVRADVDQDPLTDDEGEESD